MLAASVFKEVTDYLSPFLMDERGNKKLFLRHFGTKHTQVNYETFS